MKTFARFAALALVAASVSTGASFARHTDASSVAVAGVTAGPVEPGNQDPYKAPFPTCVPGTGCTFPTPYVIAR